MSQILSEEAKLVQQTLIERGLETPLVPNALTEDQKQTRIQSLFSEVLGTLGLDLSDDSLQETPKRMAKLYVKEIFCGLDYSNFPKLSVIENKMQLDEMVKVDGIHVSSTCEHHLITIDGYAKVAYIPKDKIIGLSKINRIVRFFAQRPQVQERLTQQVLVALQALTGTEDVAVVINATHYCVKARGIRDSLSYTKTSALGGQFLTDMQLRREFFGG